MIRYIVKPCSTKAAFEVVLDRRFIAGCIQSAREKGFETVADTPFVKILRRDIKLSFFLSGKILIEGLESKEMVERFFKENLL